MSLSDGRSSSIGAMSNWLKAQEELKKKSQITLICDTECVIWHKPMGKESLCAFKSNVSTKAQCSARKYVCKTIDSSTHMILEIERSVLIGMACLKKDYQKKMISSSFYILNIENSYLWHYWKFFILHFKCSFCTLH